MNFIEDRKYFDYELAYQMYKKVKMLFNYGGIKAVEKEFDIDDSGKDNGYIIVKDELNAYNTWVYLINKNFDTDKEEEFYVSGEVDIISYGEGDDNLYINDIETIENRIGGLLDFAKENNYTIEDYERELLSLEIVLAQLKMENKHYEVDDLF